MELLHCKYEQLGLSTSRLVFAFLWEGTTLVKSRRGLTACNTHIDRHPKTRAQRHLLIIKTLHKSSILFVVTTDAVFFGCCADNESVIGVKRNDCRSIHDISMEIIDVSIWTSNCLFSGSRDEIFA